MCHLPGTSVCSATRKAYWTFRTGILWYGYEWLNHRLYDGTVARASLFEGQAGTKFQLSNHRLILWLGPIPKSFNHPNPLKIHLININSHIIQGLMTNKDTSITWEIPRVFEALCQEPRTDKFFVMQHTEKSNVGRPDPDWTFKLSSLSCQALLWKLEMYLEHQIPLSSWNLYSSRDRQTISKNTQINYREY